MTIKAISPTIAAERNKADSKVFEVVTVRILPATYLAKREDGTDIASGILIAGVTCTAGDLVQLTAHEANELINRGRAELAAAGGV